MAKVIEFYVRDFIPTMVRSVIRDQGSAVIEFPKDKAAAVGKTAKIRERTEGDPIAAYWPGCF